MTVSVIKWTEEEYKQITNYQSNKISVGIQDIVKKFTLEGIELSRKKVKE